jgi:hypothetical protein
MAGSAQQGFACPRWMCEVRPAGMLPTDCAEKLTAYPRPSVWHAELSAVLAGKPMPSDWSSRGCVGGRSIARWAPRAMNGDARTRQRIQGSRTKTVFSDPRRPLLARETDVSVAEGFQTRGIAPWMRVRVLGSGVNRSAGAIRIKDSRKGGI